MRRILVLLMAAAMAVTACGAGDSGEASDTTAGDYGRVEEMALDDGQEAPGSGEGDAVRVDLV